MKEWGLEERRIDDDVVVVIIVIEPSRLQGRCL
jgi:hypothetical protein